MPIILIIFALLILFFVGSKMNQHEKKGIVDHFFKELTDLGCQTLDNPQGDFDYIITNNEKRVYLSFISIPNYAEVQINNPITYQIKYGAGNTVGKAQPYSKYLKGMEKLVKKEIDPESELKVICFLPNPKKITMWINECEIVFVKPETNVYSVHLLSSKELSFIKDFLIK